MERYEKSRELLGTVVKLIVFADRDLCEVAFEECERIEKNFSRFLAGNELAQLNARVGEWCEVSTEMAELLKFGIDVGEKTKGAFDITVKSLLDGWGYDNKYSFKEGGKGELGKVEFDDDGRVRVTAEVDLGGLGKGYAVDRMVGVLSGCENFCVNAGGDIFAQGRDGDEPWRMLFEHPVGEAEAIGFVDVDGMAIASSNPMKRRWGMGRHHLVNPLSGEPAGEMLAVYTQADRCIDADAYATALFVLGYDKAREVVTDLPVEAMLVGVNGAVYRSEGFKGELYTMQKK